MPTMTMNLLAQTQTAEPLPPAEDLFPILNDLAAQYGPSLIRIIIVLLIVIIANLIARRSIGLLVNRKRLSDGLAHIVNRLLFWISAIVVLFYTLKALSVLEDAWSTITAILALVAIGFVAVWSVLSNFLCSFILLFSRPFMVGDTIEFPGDPVQGKVIDFTLLYTVLEHEEAGVIRIPNNLFFQKAIHVTRGKKQIPLVQQIDAPAPDQHNPNTDHSAPPTTPTP